MKIGLVSAILAEQSFEEMISTVSRMGYSCVEAACWPSGPLGTEASPTKILPARLVPVQSTTALAP